MFGKDQATKASIETPSSIASNDEKTLGENVHEGGFQKRHVSIPPVFDTMTNVEQSNTASSRPTLTRAALQRNKRKRMS